MATMLEKRIRKAHYLYSQGRSIKEISNIMLMDESTIAKYLSEHKPQPAYCYKNSNQASRVKTKEGLLEKIGEVISPFSLSEQGKADILKALERFDLNICYQSVYSGAKYYLKKNGEITQEEVSTFLDKLPGIAYNKTKQRNKEGDNPKK